MPAAVAVSIMIRRRPWKDNAAVVPDWWRDIASQRKTIATWPEWTDPPELPSRFVGDDKNDVRTVFAETIELLVPLADEHGVGLEGVSLRITAWPYKREYDITATLEVPGGRNFITVARLDAWPVDPHMNTRARRQPGCSHLPLVLDSHHVHRFEDNARLGRDAFGAGNLPLAAEVNGRLQSYRDFLRILSVEFKIEGAEKLPSPDWTVML
jgi:hypothetical protein